ncbi:hypothetical protein ABZ725_40805 [Streptomyces sp. NPDC006872]
MSRHATGLAPDACGTRRARPPMPAARYKLSPGIAVIVKIVTPR